MARIFPGSRAVALAVVCVYVQACVCPLSRPRLALSLVACACGVCGVRGVCVVTVRPLGYGLRVVDRSESGQDVGGLGEPWPDVAGIGANVCGWARLGVDRRAVGRVHGASVSSL